MASGALPDWQQFILDHGRRAKAYELAAVLGRRTEEVLRVRETGACRYLKAPKGFSELFSLWHGRQPEEKDWPIPRKSGSRATYEWQPPEIALLASLVGNFGVVEICQMLTYRLKQITGDPCAERNRNAVQTRINKIGLQTKDVLGGITSAEAGREIGSLATINQAIHKKQLRTIRKGNLWVIPHDAWAEWKSKRTFPPKGFVQLSSIREPLSIRSDKLSEFARMGYVPTAIRCNPYGTKVRTTQFGTWFISKEVADQLLADRRAGRPMPWHGKPMADNLRATYKLWAARKHPESCVTCREIWGRKGAPGSYEEYEKQYPQLAHGAKRHLTRKWTPGMTVQEVARDAGCSSSKVRRAIESGMLATVTENGRQYITRTDATRWKARKCPSGDSEKSWISLETASSQYLFTLRELRGHIESGKLKSKIGEKGSMAGIVYVSRHQCGQLREKVGFTEEEAARRVGVTVSRFRILLEGVAWRKADRIPLITVQAVIKRLQSHEGYSIEAAAREVGETEQWVNERIHDGTIKVAVAKWDRRRKYITAPMLKRLREAKDRPVKKAALDRDWLLLSEAAFEAGVTAATIINWSNRNELPRQQSSTGWRYHREAVRARAREYWKTVRFKRATPPAWLQAELGEGMPKARLRKNVDHPRAAAA